jgi:hypothetical protein
MKKMARVSAGIHHFILSLKVGRAEQARMFMLGKNKSGVIVFMVELNRDGGCTAPRVLTQSMTKGYVEIVKAGYIPCGLLRAFAFADGYFELPFNHFLNNAQTGGKTYFKNGVYLTFGVRGVRKRPGKQFKAEGFAPLTRLGYSSDAPLEYKILTSKEKVNG